MKIIINTKTPDALKKAILSDVENGNLPTWELRTNNNGDKLLTHSPEQWVDQVLLRLTPYTTTNQLVVEPRHWSNIPKASDEVIGTVLGRFCERLFVQYPSKMNSFVADMSK